MRVVEANRAALWKYGYTGEEFVGRSTAKFRNPEDTQAHQHGMAGLAPAHSQDRWRCLHLTSSGRLMMMEMYGTNSSDAARRKLRTECMIDHTAEHDALEMLQRQKAGRSAGDRTAVSLARYRVLDDLSPQLLWRAACDGAATYQNRAWHQLVGEREGGWLGFCWVDAVHPDDRDAMRSAFLQALEARRELRFRRRIRSREGSYRAFLSVATPMLADDGSVESWVGVDTDVTDLVRHVIRQKQLDDELESVSYALSHDLRASVQVIKGFVDALLSGQVGSIDEEARGCLQRVRRNAMRMDGLITDLLSLSRLSRQMLHYEQFDPVELANSVVGVLRGRRPERKIICIAEGQVEWTADRRLFRLLLESLLDNAVKFSPDAPVCKIELRAWYQHDEVILRVSDRGVGFPPELAQGMFRPFRRLHTAERFDGAGVGLATAARIVHLHGGSIEGRNREGGGAEFELRWPRTPISAAGLETTKELA